MNKSSANFTCPCCGYLTFEEWPGSYDICHVCFWEDDPVQLLDPWCEGGANKVSLQEAQRNFAEQGVSEARFKLNVKGVLSGDSRNPLWRRVRESDRRYVTTPARMAEENAETDWKWYYWERD